MSNLIYERTDRGLCYWIIRGLGNSSLILLDLLLMRILAINTYAGSLLQGASDIPHAEIIGSYEDKAFFQPVAKANFPRVEHRPYRRDWPNQDLSEIIVLAHPPCSAFSVQNSGGADVKGVDSAAFFCTRQVLDYAMSNRALAIGIESVIGALPGAWIVHELYAREHGYDCYRILENGCMFGAQWRERFWAVWIRRGAAPPEWNIQLTPNYQTVQEVLAGHEEGPTCPGLDLALTRLKTKLVDELKLTSEQMSLLFEPQQPAHPTTWIIDVMWKHIFNKSKDLFPEEKWYVHQDVGGFSTSVMKYLDPVGTAPVLLADSFWYYNGRVLSEAGYKRLMGFPANYQFPVMKKNYRSLMRQGLSKGVMPPIVTWLLDELGIHLGIHNRGVIDRGNRESFTLMCLPEHIVDFRIRKEDWAKRHEVRPDLRHYDDERAVAIKKREKVVA
jgi:site-specific DNA-cytosine methylase